jgi:hypothetical protein
MYPHTPSLLKIAARGKREERKRDGGCHVPSTTAPPCQIWEGRQKERCLFLHLPLSYLSHPSPCTSLTSPYTSHVSLPTYPSPPSTSLHPSHLPPITGASQQPLNPMRRSHRSIRHFSPLSSLLSTLCSLLSALCSLLSALCSLLLLSTLSRGLQISCDTPLTNRSLHLAQASR